MHRLRDVPLRWCLSLISDLPTSPSRCGRDKSWRSFRAHECGPCQDVSGAAFVQWRLAGEHGWAVRACTPRLRPRDARGVPAASALRPSARLGRLALVLRAAWEIPPGRRTQRREGDGGWRGRGWEGAGPGGAAVASGGAGGTSGGAGDAVSCAVWCWRHGAGAGRCIACVSRAGAACFFGRPGVPHSAPVTWRAALFAHAAPGGDLLRAGLSPESVPSARGLHSVSTRLRERCRRWRRSRRWTARRSCTAPTTR